MIQHEDRAKVEGLLQYLHPDNKDLNLTNDKIAIILQKLTIQVLLDIRESLYEIGRNQGVDKWGPKLQQEPIKVADKPT